MSGGCMQRTFSALRHRNYRLFFAGQLISLTGTWIQNTAQAWLVYQLTGSKLLLGLVASIGSAPMLFFSIWGGSMADRYPKRNVIIVTQSISMMLAFVLAALVWTGTVRISHIIALAALGGVAMAFDMPARQAFMIEIATREDLVNAISLNSSIFNGARIIGPAMAGILMAHLNMASCYVLNGLSFLAVIIGLLLMKLPAFAPPARPRSQWQHAMEGFAYVARHPQVLRLLALFGVVGVFGWSYVVLMPALAREILGGGENEYTMLLSAGGIGAVLGALTVATFGHRIPSRVLILAGVWIFSAMLLLLAFQHNYHMALAGAVVAGWGMLLYFSTTNSLIQMSVSDEMRGRVMGIWSLVFGGIMPLGGLEAGLLSHHVGVSWTIAIGALVCALATLVIWGSLSQGTFRERHPGSQS